MDTDTYKRLVLERLQRESPAPCPEPTCHEKIRVLTTGGDPPPEDPKAFRITRGVKKFEYTHDRPECEPFKKAFPRPT